jgi:hypothetical protein
MKPARLNGWTASRNPAPISSPRAVANRDRKLAVPPEIYRGDHVRDIGASGNDQGLLVDRGVVEFSRFIVVGVVAPDDGAAETLGELCNGFAAHPFVRRAHSIMTSRLASRELGALRSSAARLLLLALAERRVGAAALDCCHDEPLPTRIPILGAAERADHAPQRGRNRTLRIEPGRPIDNIERLLRG